MEQPHQQNRLENKTKEQEDDVKELKQEIKKLQQKIEKKEQEIEKKGQEIEKEQKNVHDDKQQLQLQLQLLHDDKQLLHDDKQLLSSNITQLASLEKRLFPQDASQGTSALTRQYSSSVIWIEDNIDPIIDSSVTLGQYLTISNEYLKGTGLDVEEKAILYCRQELLEHFRFLDLIVATNQDSKKKNLAHGIIYGPPGCGKSLTTFAFVVKKLLNSDCISIWFGGRLTRHCVQFFKGKKYQLNPTYACQNDLDTFHMVLETSSTLQIVFIDNINYKNTGQFKDLIGKCLSSVRDKNCCIIFITSLSSGELSAADTRPSHIDSFTVPVWSLNDYCAAIRDKSFLTSVKDMLDADMDSTASDEDKVKAKYHFAGVYCRYMFQFNTATVIKEIQTAILHITSIDAVINGDVQGMSTCAINRIYHVNGVVSAFACHQLGIIQGPGKVKSLMQTYRANPVMRGWLFESMIFATLRHGTLQYCLDGRNVVRLESVISVKDFDPLNIAAVLAELQPFEALHPKNKIVLKPLKWNEKGYDAILIEKDDQGSFSMIFLQMTTASTHKLNGKIFKDIVNVVSSNTTLSSVQIYFITDNYTLTVTPDNCANYKKELRRLFPELSALSLYEIAVVVDPASTDFPSLPSASHTSTGFPSLPSVQPTAAYDIFRKPSRDRNDDEKPLRKKKKAIIMKKHNH